MTTDTEIEAAALVGLVRAGVWPDIQELLVAGSPVVKPHALLAAVRAANLPRWRTFEEKPDRPTRILAYIPGGDHGSLHDYGIILGAWVGETPGESGWIEQGTGHDLFEDLRPQELRPILWALVEGPHRDADPT